MESPFDKKYGHWTTKTKNSYTKTDVREAVNEDGEVINIAGLTTTMYKKSTEVKDSNLFVKLYKPNIEDLLKLKPCGTRLFYFISKMLEQDKQIIRIEPSKAIAFCGFKDHSSFYKGIKDLIKNEMIIQHEIKTYYFVNLNYFVNGDRRVAAKNFKIE